MRQFVRRVVNGGLPASAAGRPSAMPEFPSSGPAEGSPRPTIQAFAAGWNEVVTKYMPKNRDQTPNPHARPVINFDVAQSAHVWVESELVARNSGEVRPIVYNSALMLGTFCLYSAVNGWTPELMGPKYSPTPLPEVRRDFDELAAAGLVMHVKLSATAQSWSAVNWAEFDGGRAPWLNMEGGGPSRNHIIHAGLHVLGALAATPPQTGIAVRHEGRTHGLAPQGFTVSGAQAYPPQAGFPPAAMPH